MKYNFSVHLVFMGRNGSVLSGTQIPLGTSAWRPANTHSAFSTCTCSTTSPPAHANCRQRANEARDSSGAAVRIVMMSANYSGGQVPPEPNFHISILKNPSFQLPVGCCCDFPLKKWLGGINITEVLCSDHFQLNEGSRRLWVWSICAHIHLDCDLKRERCLQVCSCTVWKIPFLLHSRSALVHTDTLCLACNVRTTMIRKEVCGRNETAGFMHYPPPPPPPHTGGWVRCIC